MNLFDQDFVHTRESNPSSERILNENRKRLGKNCRTLFLEMMLGNVINSVTCIQKFGIIDWRRRRCDLTEKGGVMSSRPSALGGGLKDWWMSEQDREYNKLL